jgi:hypothetical protein
MDGADDHGAVGWEYVEAGVAENERDEQFGK